MNPDLADWPVINAQEGLAVALVDILDSLGVSASARAYRFAKTTWEVEVPTRRTLIAAHELLQRHGWRVTKRFKYEFRVRLADPLPGYRPGPAVVCLELTVAIRSSDVEPSSPKPLLPPDEICAQCGNSLQLPGERRIVAGRVSVFLMHASDSRRQQCTLITLDERYQDWSLALSGRGGRGWTPIAMERAKTAIQKGKHPWVCERCTGYTCEICGSPLILPMGSDVLEDDGAILHCPILPCIPPPCLKEGCPNYYVLRSGKESR